MINSTLCYIEYDNYILLLFRNKKERDLNEGKYVGIGGKFLENETADQCLLREVYEETGLRLHDFSFKGIVEFVSDTWEDENMYLYSGRLHGDEGLELEEALNREAVILPGTKLIGKKNGLAESSNSEKEQKKPAYEEDIRGIEVPIDCNEGTLYFVDKKDIFSLNMWEGDVRFLKPLLEGSADINMTLRYEGDILVN